MLAEGALDVPSLVAGHGREVSPERVSAGRPGWPLGGVARIERDHALAHAEFLAAKAMVVPGIKASICQGRIEADQFCGLAHGRDEVGRVLAGACARHGSHDQVGSHVHDGGQLRPGSLPMSHTDAAQAELGADMPGLQAGRVHRGHGLDAE